MNFLSNKLTSQPCFKNKILKTYRSWYAFSFRSNNMFPLCLQVSEFKMIQRTKAIHSLNLLSYEFIMVIDETGKSLKCLCFEIFDNFLLANMKDCQKPRRKLFTVC